MTLKLADDQRFALMKLRRSVKDALQPQHDDHFLVRWLRARKWDPVAAEKMLRDSLAWRKRWDVDKIEEWETPKIITEYLPHGVSGFDKDGAPVIIVPFAGLDLYGILHCTTRREMLKATIQQLEFYLKLCKEQADKHGPAAGQCTVIFDMDNFNLKQYMWRPAGEVVITLIQLYEANYPEILKICFIINAPKVFTLAFSIAKKFMNEYTLSKIQIYKADPRKWQPAILQLIPENQFPSHFGGTLKDADGNPRLTSKINQGGKVPKHLYSNKNDKENTNNDIENELISATIKKGDKLKLEFSPQVGSLLSWEFKSDDNEIKFGVTRKTSDGPLLEIIPIHKVNAKEKDEIGILTCEVPATYTIVFDNSQSLLRSKKIQYSVKVIPPGAMDNLAVEKS